MDDLTSFDAHWLWIAGGLVLATLELLVPGVYLIWLAVAAIMTGVLTVALDLGLPAQVIIFTSISLIAAFSARRYFNPHSIVAENPLINHKTSQLIGQSAIVTQPIEHGEGRVKLGDSEWMARGPELASGARVRVTGSDGTVLIVEPLALPPASAPSDEAE